MPDVAAFHRVAPGVPAQDLDAALDRDRRLGFAVRPYTGGERYDFAGRGGVSLHLVEWAEHNPGRTGAQVYI
jgi:hypothetical protein